MKKLIGIIIGLVLICVVTYFGFSFYISQMTKELVESSWKHENVLPEKYEGVLNLYTYKQLDWLNKASSTNVKAIKQDFSYPSTENKFCNYYIFLYNYKFRYRCSYCWL